MVDQAAVTLTVPTADLALTGLPTNLTLPVSTTVTFAFTVTNRGGAAGEGTLGLTFSDVVEDDSMNPKTKAIIDVVVIGLCITLIVLIFLFDYILILG